MASSLAAKRGFSLVLERKPSWDCLGLQACIVEKFGACPDAEKSPRGSDLRVVTWNVWFDDLAQHERALALMTEALALRPDVICLQEVLPGFAEAIRSCDVLTSVFDVSSESVHPYGCLMLVHRSLAASFEPVSIPSRMSRNIIEARCSQRLPGLVLATSHLESLNSTKTRREQLEVAASRFANDDRVMFCGDFNFDDRQSWGDWAREVPLQPPEELENHVLKDVLPDYLDVWQHCHPEDPGNTFDGATNPVCVGNPDERMRYDRIMSKGMDPIYVKILGTEAISEQGVRPSDHFGLMADFSCASPTPPASAEHSTL